MLHNLDKYNIMLASKSPRRKELLAMLDVPYSQAPAIDIEESFSPSLRPTEIPEYLARLKAEAYAELITGNEMIITADTVVILGNEVIGKPDNPDAAVNMLLHLSGKEHLVVTGVAITTSERQDTFSVESHVKFGNISPMEAQYYVEKYMPLDKAGSYGIQEWIGAVAVESIRGSFYNVMGLPVHQLYRHLQKF